MAIKEILIYGLNGDNTIPTDRYTDEDFITMAEDEGHVFTLSKFLGLCTDHEIPAHLDYRAFLIDMTNPESKPIRIDLYDTVLDVNLITTRDTVNNLTNLNK